MKKSPVFIFFLALSASLLICTSCKPGEGGKGSIKGQVFYTDTALMIVNDSVDAPVTLYISYGEDTAVSADQEIISDSDGLFEFTPLKKGDYYIWAVYDHPLIPKEYVGGKKVTLEKDQAAEIEIEVD